MPRRTELPDEAIENRSREIGEKWGASTQIGATQQEPGEPTAPLISVRFDCPDYLDRAISIEAAGQNCTKTYLILKALKLAGYEIRDVDLVVDRRKLRGKRAETVRRKKTVLQDALTGKRSRVRESRMPGSRGRSQIALLLDRDHEQDRSEQSNGRASRLVSRKRLGLTGRERSNKSHAPIVEVGPDEPE